MLWRTRMMAFAVLLAVGVTVLRTPAPAARQANSIGKSSLTVDLILRCMEEKNRERAEALREFQGIRVYRMQYRGFFGSRDADMTVKLAYKSPDDKAFTILSEHGTKYIIDHVFKGLLDGEKEAATVENQHRTALTAENYNFTLVGFEGSQDAPQYVLNVVPKTDNRFLYRGRVWIDAKDFAVTRVEAEPAKNPSFWIKKTEISHRYGKVGDFWLPVEDRTQSLIRLGGRAILSIDYKDYEITDRARLSLPSLPGDGAVPGTLDFAARKQDCRFPVISD